jgi:hypothetical protein
MEKKDKKTINKENIFRQTSDLPGLLGTFEVVFRKFRVFSFSVLTLSVFGLGLVCIGLALIPSVFIVLLSYEWCQEFSLFLKSVIIAFTIAIAYLSYGVSVCFVAPALNFILPLKIRSWRGIWHSLQSIPWYLHNALTYIVRYTFLDMVTPTPLNTLFFRMMGMKIGKGVVINSTNISDPCLITLGDYVTIGGSATIFAHYGQKGYLVVAPVVIKKGTTIGLKASVMGGVTVGEDAHVLAHAVVLPNTQIADGEMYTGPGIK